MSSRSRHFFSTLLLGASLLLAGLQTAGATECLDCSDPVEPLDALRKKLPADWLLQMEREPVFNGKVLTVQAGLENQQTILLVHGLGQNGFGDWLKIIPHLAQHYHVIALDLPGFGYSSHPFGKYSPRNYARLLSWLVATHGKGPAIVAGHSMGAAVALRFGGDHPEQVSKLILVDAAGVLHRNPFLNRTSTASSTLPFPLREFVTTANSIQDIALDQILSIPLPHELLGRNDIVWGVMLPISNMNAALALVDEDLSDAIYTQKAPVHLIWGELDGVAPMRTGQMLGNSLPRAQLHVLPQIGHIPMESATASFLALLDKTLATDPVPTAAIFPESDADAPDLICNAASGRQYSGIYRNVLIDRCLGATLTGLTARNIVIRNSRVNMVNVNVRGEGVALDVDNSVVTMTASSLSGDVAIRADDSRLDLAGVKLVAQTNAVQVKRWTRLIGSVNFIHSPAYTGAWHGRRILEMATLIP